MNSGTDFEKTVINVARSLWTSAEYSGSEIHAGKERDGIFICEDVIHLLECTVSRAQDKAEKDGRKLFELAQRFKETHPEMPVKAWFITQQEPTADQRTAIKKISAVITILSFQQFQAKLVNSAEYLHLRSLARFGSIADPKTGGLGEKLPYVEIDLLVTGGTGTVSTQSIADRLLKGDRFCLFGDFGIGKSMTLRDIFRKLAAKHHKGETSFFPVYINLREHHGQSQPVEIIERHARLLGFPSPSQIVRAWRSGYCVLLLDGFDEISSLGLQGGWRRLKDVRAGSMRGLRALINDSPAGTGIVVAGRTNFFDSDTERRESTETASFVEVNLSEFNDGQISKFLQLSGYTGSVPSWMPSRPLLLSALFGKGVKAVGGDGAPLEEFASADPSAGWDMLVQEICDREAKIESGLSGEMIRHILENLASRARCTPSGLGPLSPSEMGEAFHECCGYSPADQALTVLQRLSGFGTDPSRDDDSRNFIDADFADACCAGTFAAFCKQPYSTDWPGTQQLQHVLGPVGLGVAARRLAGLEYKDAPLKAAFAASEKLRSGDIIRCDLVQLALQTGESAMAQVVIDAIDVPQVYIGTDQSWLNRVTFCNCGIRYLYLDPAASSEHSPNFVECMIEEIDGRVSARDLPPGRFTDCLFDSFSDDVKTNTAVFKTEAPVGVKVLLSILKKLFVQSLSGREEGAFSRGIDPVLIALVPEVLSIARKHNFAILSDRTTDRVWLPVRRKKSEVLEILSAPMTSQHPLVSACRELRV